MIEIKRLVDCKGAEVFGSCQSCCKPDTEDTEMKRITIRTYLGQGTSVCLCSECLEELRNKL